MTPNGTYCAGNSAADARVIASTSTTLIHQGERSNTANSEFLAILNFTRYPWMRPAGPRAGLYHVVPALPVRAGA